jgi:hypothetical protein
VSGDRSNNRESRMTVLWKSFRDENDQATNGVFSKTVVRYTHPFDLRFSAYLVINNEDRPDDQFVYLNSRRRTRRVNLRGEPVLGSDFGFEDVIPREIEDAEYRRLPDDVHDGRGCHVVEIVPLASANSEYSRLRSWIDKQHPVVLRTQYWDHDGIAVKEGTAPFAEVREIEASGFPCTRMKNLVSESWSRLVVEDLSPTRCSIPASSRGAPRNALRDGYAASSPAAPASARVRPPGRTHRHREENPNSRSYEARQRSPRNPPTA